MPPLHSELAYWFHHISDILICNKVNSFEWLNESYDTCDVTVFNFRQVATRILVQVYHSEKMCFSEVECCLDFCKKAK